MTKINKAVVLSKLDQLSRGIHRLEEHLPKTASELINNLDNQDIIAHNLQKVIQASVDTASYICSLNSDQPAPQTMADCFEQLFQQKIINQKLCEQLKKAVGLRNVLVHEYVGINWEIVFAVVKNKLEIFREFSSALLKHLGN